VRKTVVAVLRGTQPFRISWRNVSRLVTHLTVSNQRNARTGALKLHFRGTYVLCLVRMTKGRVVMARRMRSGAGKPQISPLRYPGFPVETRGTDELHAVFFKGKPHTWSLPAARSGKSGYPLSKNKPQPPDFEWVAQVSILRPGFLLANGC